MTSVIDIDAMVAPLADDAPSGPDLDDAYDEAYTEFNRMVDAAEWSGAEAQGVALFERTRDLRVSVPLCRVLLECHGLVGFAEGVALTRRLVVDLWDSVHPELDEEPPPLRTNVMMGLGIVEGSQTVNPLHDRLRRVPFVDVPVVGAFGLRDYLIASGEIEVPAEEEAEGESPTTGLINAAIQEANREDLQATASAMDGVVNDVTEIAARFTEAVGAASSPNLQSLKELAGEIRDVLVRLGGLDIEPAVEEDGGEPGAASTGVAQVAIAGEINSRQDAIVALDKVSAYFEKNEPSSPVPLLVNRARRMISMSFMELLKDLAPGGLDAAEHIIGSESGGNNIE